MSDAILIEQRGGLEIVTLNRGQSLNALSEEMTIALVDYFDGLHKRHDVRVVILKAEGKNFCAGLDFNGWPKSGDETPVLGTLRTQTMIGNIYRRMRSCPQPIIALAQGAACGGGLSLLCASDVRFGTPDFRMNAAYIRIGLGGCDMASSYFLPRLVGASLASEMILTGRFIKAERAVSSGFLSEIVEHDALLTTGIALAEEMLAIADTPVLGVKIKTNEKGETETVEGDMIEHRRLQVDSRKWMLSKMLPKKYGDKIETTVQGQDGGPVKMEATIRFVKPEPREG